MQTLVIRDAKREDLPEIVRIYNETIPSRMVTADVEAVSIEDKTAWFDEHEPSVRPLWVLENRGKICAWVSFQSFYGRPAYHITAEISIYVDEGARGQGYGRLLLQKAIDACPSLGIKTLLAFIFGHNEPSLRLFRSFGFCAWGTLPRVAELDGVERDLIIMGKRVTK